MNHTNVKSIFQDNRNKAKKNTNGLNQTYKFYTVKTINKMTTCGLGKNICKDVTDKDLISKIYKTAQ